MYINLRFFQIGFPPKLLMIFISEKMKGVKQERDTLHFFMFFI